MMFSHLTAWIVADDKKIGTHSQCWGIAHVLGLSPVFKLMKPRWPWQVLPPQLWLAPLKAQSAGYGSLTVSSDNPYPDILIAGGRASVAPAIAIRKDAHRNGKKCFTIFLQDPCVNPRHFDCVITPHHDHIQGSSVIPILGALHWITHDKIKAASMAHPPLPKSPVTTVLLGGDCRHYRYQKSDILALSNALIKTEGHILITPSRRTRPELIQALKDSLKDRSYEIWDRAGENPYLAYLGLADQIIASGESVSMVSEACFTGKPVYIWEPGHTYKKHYEFQEALYAQGYAKPFRHPLPPYTPKKLDEAQRIANTIKEKVNTYFQ